MPINDLIQKAVEARSSQICAERAKSQGVEQFKQSMSMTVLGQILGSANDEMDKYLFAALSLFCENHHIDLNEIIEKDKEKR